MLTSAALLLDAVAQILDLCYKIQIFLFISVNNSFFYFFIFNLCLGPMGSFFSHLIGWEDQLFDESLRGSIEGLTLI